MKPKQGTPSWISGGFLGKGCTLQESSGKESPAGWHCTKGKVYAPPTPGGPGAPGATLSVPYTPVLSVLTDPPRAPGEPSPSPRARHRGLCWRRLPAAASLPGAQRPDLGWGRPGEQIQEDLTPFSPASCWSGRTSPRAPAGPPWPERTRKCRKEHKGSRERAELPAGLGASLSIARSGPCDGPLSTQRWDSVAPDVPGP